MAKVKTEKTGYNIDGRWVPWTKTWNVDTETGVFWIDLPIAMSTAIGIEQVTGKTLDEVNRAFDAAKKDYASAKIVETKVILYRFLYHTAEKDPSHYTFGGDQGIMLQMNAAVYRELKGTAKSGKQTWDYEPINTGLKYPLPPYDLKQMNHEYERRLVWTQQLEEFFVNSQAAMYQIIDKIDQLNTPLYLEEYAQSNLLLSGPKTADVD